MFDVSAGLVKQQRGFVGLERRGGPQHPLLCSYIHWGTEFGPAYFSMTLVWDSNGESYCDSRGGTVAVEADESFCVDPNGRRKSALVATERIVGWKADPWPQCDETNQVCGISQQSRVVQCSDNIQNILPDSECDGMPKPPTTQDCVRAACDGIMSAPAEVTGASVLSALPASLTGGWAGVYATRTTQMYCGKTMKRSVVDIEITAGASGADNETLLLPRLSMQVRDGIATPLPLLADLLEGGSEAGTAVPFIFEGVITGYDHETRTISVANPALPLAGAKSLKFFPDVDGIPQVREQLASANRHHLMEAGPGAALFAFSYDEPSLTPMLRGPNDTASCPPSMLPLLKDLWEDAPDGRIEFFRVGRRPGEYQLGEFERCEPNLGLGVCQSRRSVLTTACFFPNSTYAMDTAMCDGAPQPPPQLRNCSACVAFDLSQWSNCTAECSGGMREREVDCVKTSYENRPRQPLSVCQAILGGVVPAEEERCNIEPCASWVIGQWGSCSQPCGTGQKVRNVECREVQSGAQVPEEQHRARCGESPAATTACSLCPCERTDLDVTAVRKVPAALQQGALEDPAVAPLSPHNPSSPVFAGYANVSADTFCGSGQELLTLDQFRCFPATFQRELCTQVYSKASPGSIPAAFRARPEDLPLAVPRWLTAAGASYGEFEPDIVMTGTDSQCNFPELQYEDKAFVVEDRQAAVGVCRQLP